MKNLPQFTLLAAALGFSVTASVAHGQSNAATPDNSFTGKVALFSEYEYRGISQTSEKPAVQLNLDYAHKSGFYLGTFVSNINWLKDTAKDNGFSSNSKIEVDIYGGFKAEVVKDVTVDVGYLHYEYPSSSAFSPKPNTDEVYVGASYGPASVKYSYSVKDSTFGVPNSKGSDYIEAAINYPIPTLTQLTVNGTVGRQTYKNAGFLSYTVTKLGATWDFGKGLTAGAYYKGTDAQRTPYTIQGRDWSKDRLVAFVAYGF